MDTHCKEVSNSEPEGTVRDLFNALGSFHQAQVEEPKDEVHRKGNQDTENK